MLKMKRMAILAVVALGLVAIAAPAGASANKRTNADIKRLGENVNELRKKTDEMNRTISSLATVAGSSLTKLQDGLVGLANNTANFKFGVVQVATRAGSAAAGDSLRGLGPKYFYATPPLYQVGEQASVTFPVQSAGLATGMRLLTSVRSVNPDQGKVACRIAAAGTDIAGTGVNLVTTQVGSAATGFVKQMPQSVINPSNANSTTDFPFGLVEGGADKVVDLAEPNDQTGGRILSGTGVINVTLTCIAAS